MNVTIENTAAGIFIVRGEVSTEEVANGLDEMLNEYGAKMHIPGFRPGKAPRSMVLARHGNLFRNELAQKFVREIVNKAVEQEPAIETPLYIDDPKFDALSEGSPFCVEIYVEIKPKFQLKKYKEFQLQRPAVPVTDKEIDDTIADFLDRNATLEKREYAARENSYVGVKLSIDGAEPVPMIIPLDDPEFAQFFRELTGKSVGDKIEIEREFPDSFPDRRLQGRKGKFGIEITEVFELVKPALDNDFLKKIGKPDGYGVADFRAEVAEYVRGQKAKDADMTLKARLIDAIIENNPIEIPPKYLDARTGDYMNERWDITKLQKDEAEKLRQGLKPTIARQASYQMLIEAIADVENIEPSEQEVRDSIRRTAVSLGINPDAADKACETGSERYKEFKRSARNDKALDFILSTCTVVDERVAIEPPSAETADSSAPSVESS